MRQMVVVNAFLDGQCIAEPALSKDGVRLYLRDKMIACNRDGNLSTAAAEKGYMDENLNEELFMEFAEWRKRRERTLRSVTGGMQRLMGPRALTQAGHSVRCRRPTWTRERLRESDRG